MVRVSIAKRVLRRVKVKKSKRASVHTRRFPQSSYSKKVSKFKL